MCWLSLISITKIFYDTFHSHAATHFADTPGLKELVIEVLESRRVASSLLEFDVDMKRIIGTCDVVEIDESDEVVYAVRKNRPEQGFVPFTKSRTAQPDSYISISLIVEPDGTYKLSTLHYKVSQIGKSTPIPYVRKDV